jgi:hypothetical protein
LAPSRLFEGALYWAVVNTATLTKKLLYKTAK